MIQIKIPVANNIEVIITDMYINVDIRLNPQQPIKTIEGRLALDALQTRLRYYSQKMAVDLLNEIENSITPPRL